MEPISALIAAGATIGGGIINRSAQRHAEQRDDTQIQRRMRDASAAGVHPIAALGMSGYSGSTATSTAFGDSVAKSGQAIGNALSRSLDTDGRALKALVLEKAGLENDLLRTQIRRAQVEDASVPPVLGPNSRQRIAGQGQTLMLPDVPGVVVGHKPEDPTFTPSYRVGRDVVSNPNFSDAQVIQNRHGEWAEGAYGAISIPADLYWNWKRGMYNNKEWNYIVSRLATGNPRSRQEIQR